MHLRRFVLLLFMVTVLIQIPVAAAQETRSGGQVVVESGETVQGLTATGGTVIVRGTVDGDLTAAAGHVLVEGNVTGDATVAGGSVAYAGSVVGNATTYAGDVELRQGGEIGGLFEAVAGNAALNGTIGSDARVQAEKLVVGAGTVIGGDLVHATQTLDLSNEATINGSIRGVDSIDIAPFQMDLPLGSVILYGFLVNLVVGALLLLLVPGFSLRVADRVRERPLFSLGVGIVTLLVTPVILALLAITIIGIPLAVIGLIMYLVAIWLANIYGSIGIGRTVLAAVNRTNKWLALVIGLVIVSLLGAIPVVGGLIHFLVLLVGLGAMVLRVRR